MRRQRRAGTYVPLVVVREGRAAATRGALALASRGHALDRVGLGVDADWGLLQQRKGSTLANT